MATLEVTSKEETILDLIRTNSLDHSEIMRILSEQAAEAIITNGPMSLEDVTRQLQEDFGFSEGSVAYLQEKGLGEDELTRLYASQVWPKESYDDRNSRAGWLEKLIDRGGGREITTGRYDRYVRTFDNISSEQALVQGRMKFAVEYIIELADLVGGHNHYSTFIPRKFTPQEKRKLRSIYKEFTTSDFAAAAIIERKTNHDIVAANTWVTIKAQQLGLDENLVRRVVHFARTSADVNTNVTGELYTRAIGQWCSAMGDLIGELETRGKEYAHVSCVAQTHGQDAQMTTVGHIYANMAEQLRQHLEPLIGDQKLLVDGKIAGAIGTDVDWKAAIPDMVPTKMYQKIVEKKFGLKFIEFGNDQDCSNASLARALDAMVNAGYEIKKSAGDIWIYASRGMLAKITGKGESGSSAMPQKTNPFFAEGAEALESIANAMVAPIKEMMIAYREQGDLRRSITKREGFHPIMLSIIAIKRLIGEIKKYQPNVAAIEQGVYQSGPKVVSSALQTYLKVEGVSDAYDGIKDVVMKPFVTPGNVDEYITGLQTAGRIDRKVAGTFRNMLHSVMDTQGLVDALREDSDGERTAEIYHMLEVSNRRPERQRVLGNAITHASVMANRAQNTRERLMRYAA